MITGKIFQIQRFSVHDGPGIRTTLFLKGCNNRCSWCHNPESLSTNPEVQLFPERCIGCGECVKVCPSGARYNSEKGLEFNRRLCTACGLCTEVCWAGAMEHVGKDYTLDKAVEEALRDRIYYDQSGGGVTLSGGEPLMQPRFAEALLTELKKQGLHTAVQTAGAYSYDRLEPLLDNIDLIMFDLKGFTPEIYKTHIGNDRDQVFSTLEKLLSRWDGDIAVRTPLVGGVNDTADEIEGITRWLGKYKERILYYELIPYHSLGLDKYHRLGMPGNDDFTTPPPEKVRSLEKTAAAFVNVKYNVSSSEDKPQGVIHE